MKKRFVLKIILVGFAALTFASCGNGTNNCTSGQVYSNQYGCIAKGNCGTGCGQAPSGGCVSLTGTNTNTVGTVTPIGQPGFGFPQTNLGLNTCGTNNTYNPYGQNGTCPSNHWAQVTIGGVPQWACFP